MNCKHLKTIEADFASKQVKGILPCVSQYSTSWRREGLFLLSPPVKRYINITKWNTATLANKFSIHNSTCTWIMYIIVYHPCNYGVNLKEMFVLSFIHPSPTHTLLYRMFSNLNHYGYVNKNRFIQSMITFYSVGSGFLWKIKNISSYY